MVMMNKFSRRCGKIGDRPSRRSRQQERAYIKACGSTRPVLLISFYKLKLSMESDGLRMFGFIGKAQDINDIVKGFDDLYDPKASGFNLLDVRAIGMGFVDNKEVWMDSKAYMIRRKTSLYDRFVEWAE